jgi:flagellar motor switch protein FliN/FliY
MSSSQNLLSSSDAADPLAPLHDVTCQVDVVLGTASMTVRQCLSLKRDSVIRLSQSAGSDLQIVVNNIGLALGEVVIIDSSTAVRVTDILPPPSNEATL